VPTTDDLVASLQKLRRTETLGALPQALDRLARLAVELFDADLAALAFHRGGVSRVVASSGLEARFRSLTWDFAAVRYAPDERVVLPDATKNQDASAVRRFLGLDAVGFLLREPIDTHPDHSLALIILGREARSRPSRRQLKLLAEIVDAIRTTAAPHLRQLAAAHPSATTALSLNEAYAAVETAPWPAALFDSRQHVLALNSEMARLIGRDAERAIGKAPDELRLPMGGAIMQLQEQALRTGLSPPDVEVISPADSGRRAFQLHLSPFSPTDDAQTYLYAAAREVTDGIVQERQIAERIRLRRPDSPSAPVSFLLETLVARRAIRNRKAMQYLTLRSWRSNLKSWQIKTLRALKADIPPELPDRVADEILADVTALFGLGAFHAIVPVPCGHSGEGPCFSLEIARALALRSGIPVARALESRPQRGSSHPKENVKRPPMVLAQRLSGPALIVDDVATSGSHLEEAVTLLRPGCGSTLAVAWIGAGVG